MKEIGLTLNETNADSDATKLPELFRRKQLRNQLALRQAELRPVTPRRHFTRLIAKRDIVKVTKYPPLLCREHCDPDDIGTTKRAGFDKHGKLLRQPIKYRMHRHCIGVTRLRHLALATTLPATSMTPENPNQLRPNTHWARLSSLAELYVARLRNLRRQSCAVFRTPRTYAQALYCPPTGTYAPFRVGRTGAVVSRFEHCDLRRICPFCWTQAYVVEPFFRLRAVLDSGSGEIFTRRKDCRLVCARQTWSYPYDTHPFEMLADLQSRKAQLYRETPSSRAKLIAMVQLHYIEPPVRKGKPWLLQRRAVLVCHKSMRLFEYPDDSYDVCNETYSQTPTLKHLTAQLGRNFNYPAALLLADSAIVRRLLDAYVYWPHSTQHGFELYTTRGNIEKIHHAYRMKALGYGRELEED
jgi:hypothetical protein